VFLSDDSAVSCESTLWYPDRDSWRRLVRAAKEAMPPAARSDGNDHRQSALGVFTTGSRNAVTHASRFHPVIAYIHWQTI